MPKLQSAQLVVVSDLHVGSKIGLMPPTVELDDGNIVSQNQLQKDAWKYWTKEFWPYVENRSKGRKTVVVLNGDGLDGVHHNTTQIWSNDPLEQAVVAAEIMAPIANKYPVYVTRGTPTHVLVSGAGDELIAREIGAKQPVKGRKVHSSYHLKLVLEGVDFDIAHHGPSAGTRIWTYGNALRGYARTIILDAMVQHRRPPDCIIRSHFHHRVHETTHDYGHTCHAIITPAWQWKSEYVHMVVSHEDVCDIGGVVIDIDDGKITNVDIRTIQFVQSDRVVA